MPISGVKSSANQRQNLTVATDTKKPAQSSGGTIAEAAREAGITADTKQFVTGVSIGLPESAREAGKAVFHAMDPDAGLLYDAGQKIKNTASSDTKSTSLLENSAKWAGFSSATVCSTDSWEEPSAAMRRTDSMRDLCVQFNNIKLTSGLSAPPVEDAIWDGYKSGDAGTKSEIHPGQGITDESEGAKYNTAVRIELLKKLVEGLENDITSGRWDTAAFYADEDLELMPDLVTMANTKHPGLNLKYVNSPQDLPELIKSVPEGCEYFRFIVNTGKGNIHFVAIDGRVIEGKKSLILFDSTQFRCGWAKELALKAEKSILDARIPDCYFSLAEMNIQKSYSECGIFSLAIAKKLHTKSDNLLKMHEDNITGIIKKSSLLIPSTWTWDSFDDLNFISYKETDKYLPADFYKHTQSERRLEKYMDLNSSAEYDIVNKKHQTLSERFKEHTVISIFGGKEKSFSVHAKRIAEYNSLIENYTRADECQRKWLA